MKVRPFSSRRRAFVFLPFALIFALLLATPSSCQSTRNPVQSLVFTHVTVIDATGALARRDMTVVASGERLSNTKRIAAVVVNGKLLTKAQLTEMLAGVERAAAAGR
ncbi:MAG TPA: hypothetical protein VGC87_20750 [Pyrinomonadaceae bacterium]|jgi:hypothetical protein